MHYDVTILTVRPGTTPKALPRIEEWLGETQSAGRLLACWFTELGALNLIMLIREYASEAAISADRDAAVRSGNPYGIADLTVATSCDTYRSFPFILPMQAGAIGPVFEVRTYVLKPAGLARPCSFGMRPCRTDPSCRRCWRRCIRSVAACRASCTSGPTPAWMHTSASAARR